MFRRHSLTKHLLFSLLLFSLRPLLSSKKSLRVPYPGPIVHPYHCTGSKRSTSTLLSAQKTTTSTLFQNKMNHIHSKNYHFNLSHILNNKLVFLINKHHSILFLPQNISIVAILLTNERHTYPLE